MYEFKEKSFINSYGVEEKYQYVILESFMSGHLYRGSMFETCSSCGNCDGGRCDTCGEVYKLIVYSKPYKTDEGYMQQDIVRLSTFTSKDEALKHFNNV